MNDAWFKAEKTGIYYGQCDQLCGVNHAFMPIEIKVVTQPEFDAWVASQTAPAASAAASSPDSGAPASTAAASTVAQNAAAPAPQAPAAAR